jgi:hypothetical protein
MYGTRLKAMTNILYNAMNETKMTLNCGLEIPKNLWFIRKEKSVKGVHNKPSESISNRAVFTMVHHRKNALRVVISIINLLF